MPSRGKSSKPSASFQPVDLEGRRLVRETVALCRKISKWERYPFMEKALGESHDAGLSINKACRTYNLKKKVEHLLNANKSLDDLWYTVEVMMEADVITDDEKAVWDEQNNEVRRQVAIFLNSLQARLGLQSSEAESAGCPGGVTSNKKDAPSHLEDR